MLVLVLLTVFAWWSGAAVARKVYVTSAAERALASMLLAFGEIVFVIQVLGWSNLLTRLNLGLGSLACSAVVSAMALRGEWRAGAIATTKELGAQVALPFVAVAEAWREKSGVVIGLVATALLLVWTTLLSWLATSGAWDGLWYHESMVGFALQYEGFGLVEVPRHLEWVNGYPRTSEHLMLWLTAFEDRKLIDWTQQLVSPIALLSVYVLAKRHNGGWRVGAAGIAVTLWTIPAVVLQMRSTYIDVTVMSCFLAVLVFVTRRPFRVPDLWMTALALGLLGGTKASMLLYMCMLGLPALWSAAALGKREGWLRVVAHALGGVALIAVLMAPSYVRNWVLHDNPIWPLHYEIAGIELEGPEDFGNMQKSTEEVIHELWGHPTPGQDYHDTQKHAYGYSLSFVGIPLLLAALFFMARRLVFGPRRREVWALWVTVLFGFLTLALSPAFHWARYALPAPAVGLVACAWVLHEWRARRLAEGLITAMIVLNLITLKWADPGWDVSVETAYELLHRSEASRIATRTSNNLPPEELVHWRIRNVREGDVVAMGNRITFVSNLWNERMNSRVVYVPWHDAEDRRPYPERVLGTGARIAVVEGNTPEGRAMSRAEGWERIGKGPYEDTWYQLRE